MSSSEDLILNSSSWKLVPSSECGVAASAASTEKSMSLGSVGELDFTLSASDAEIMNEYAESDFILVLCVSEEKTHNIDCAKVEMAGTSVHLRSGPISFTSDNGFSEDGEYSAHPALKISQDGDLVTFDLLNEGQSPLNFKITKAVAEPAVVVPTPAPKPQPKRKGRGPRPKPATAAVEPATTTAEPAATTAEPATEDDESTYSSVKSCDEVIGSAKPTFVKPGKVRLSVCLSEDVAIAMAENKESVNKIKIHTADDESVLVKASIIPAESKFECGAVSILSDQISEETLAKIKGKVLSVSCKLQNGLKVDRAPLYIPAGAVSKKSVKFNTTKSSVSAKSMPTTSSTSSTTTTSATTSTVQNINRGGVSPLLLAFLLALIAILIIAGIVYYYNN